MKYLSTLNLNNPVVTTGTNALRHLSDRFADVINLKDQVLGVGTGNAAIDTSAMTLALAKAAANPGSTILIPAGSYVFAIPASSTLFVIPPSTKIIGAGRDQVLFTWNDDSGCTLFGSSGTSSVRSSNIVISGLTVQGTAATKSYTNTYAFNLAYVDRLEFVDIATAYTRNTPVLATYCTDVVAHLCSIQFSMGDGINCQGCAAVAISDNDIRHIDGDAISVNSDTSDVGKVRRNISIDGNAIFDAQGIRVMSARHLSLTGNQMDAIRTYGINLSTVAPTGSGTLVGAAAGLAISITGNTITNLINRQNIDNQTQGCPGIIISGASARAGTYGAIPGEANTSTGVVVDPYREYFANANLSTTPTAGIYAITISGNTIARTLPACNNSDSRFTSWSDFGLGTIYTKSGAMNPSLAESDMRDAAVVLSGGVIRDVMISNNMFRGLDSGLNVLNGTRYDNITFRANDVIDCYSNGVFVNTGGILRLYVDVNTFDLDPYLKHSNRGPNGTWQTTAGPVAINQIAGSGIYVRGNTLRNLTLDYSGNSSLASSGAYFDRNIVEADPIGFDTFSTSNKGIGLVHSNFATIFSRVDSDPSSVTFGSVLTMPQMPTASLVGRMSAGSGASETIPLGAGLVVSNGSLNISLPSPMFANLIEAAGGVQTLTVTGAAGYHAFPTITLAAPPAGGAQAAASVATMGVYTFGGILALGTGYSVNDVLTFTGGTFSTAATIRVTSINGSGGITGFTGVLPGSYSALPSTTITLTGGTGSGATLSGLLYTPLTATITAAGGLYVTPPAVTFSSYAGSSATGTTTLSNNFLLTGGNGQVQLTNSGTLLGTYGAAGYGVVNNGATLDQSKVRFTATGTAYSIPANTSWLAMIQTGTVASQTLTFPVASGDGQILRISTYGAITALTLTPQSGTTIAWTNGSQLAASSGMTFGWDASLSMWMRL